MSVVYLLRHGQASFGAADYDVLSEVGKRQAEVLGEELASRGVVPSRAVSGTLSRQRDTASITLAAAGWTIESDVDARWDEYDHIGLVQALVDTEHVDPPASSRDFQALLDRALDKWVQTDGYRDFADGAFAALMAAAEAGTAVVFTSGGIIAALCSRLTGSSVVAINRVVVNAAITKVVVGRSGATLVSFNEHRHFEGAGRDLLTYR
ncbi:Phosphoglycerate mutase family protein [Alloactinosynnema sp. L-07]|uniref:histidine phosphatase family protein n=1 Tax=Alloactinosynnema sp. L-07 TaxID=1653480 RepID=UPI00065F0350|nr:histidine phosphatase family protein [Alloactinosynnema sp. L-07]CRK55044.1 Phosphoglycerate mutase family protein [Alloactinosynnema sp. L-07]